jgi:hypothetical protein
MRTFNWKTTAIALVVAVAAATTTSVTPAAAFGFGKFGGGGFGKFGGGGFGGGGFHSHWGWAGYGGGYGGGYYDGCFLKRYYDYYGDVEYRRVCYRGATITGRVTGRFNASRPAYPKTSPCAVRPVAGDLSIVLQRSLDFATGSLKLLQVFEQGFR